MLHRAIVLVSLTCCTLVCASFGLFAHDQIAGASEHQQSELAATPSPRTLAGLATAPVARSVRSHRPHRVGQPRRFIDGAARELISPFRSLVGSANPWVTRGVPTVVALLVYGLGLGFLARFAIEPPFKGD